MSLLLPGVCLLFSVSVLMSLIGAKAGPDRMPTIIVDRTATTIEVYLAVPGDQAGALFQTSPDALSKLANDVAVLTSSQIGTWDLADTLWSSVTTELGGQQIVFEAMSLMVHPSDLSIPFRDPIDGNLAVGICSVFSTESEAKPRSTSIYAAFIVFADDTSPPLTIKFPDRGDGEKSFRVRTFENGEPVTVRDVSTLNHQIIL